MTETLRERYLNAGYSRRAFADHIGVPEQTIRRLEAGMGVSPAYAKKVADWLGCQVVDLLPAEGQAA